MCRRIPRCMRAPLDGRAALGACIGPPLIAPSRCGGAQRQGVTTALL